MTLAAGLGHRGAHPGLARLRHGGGPSALELTGDRVSRLGVAGDGLGLGRARADRGRAEIPGNTIRVHCSFKNYGKTPAFIKQITGQVEHLSAPPEEIRYLPIHLYVPLELFFSGEKSVPSTDFH